MMDGDEIGRAEEVYQFVSELADALQDALEMVDSGPHSRESVLQEFAARLVLMMRSNSE
jgi:hypothetical protein